MRVFSFFAVVLALCFAADKAAAQCTPAVVNGVPWSDDFDSYSAPSGIAGQGEWELWDLILPNAMRTAMSIVFQL